MLDGICHLSLWTAGGSRGWGPHCHPCYTLQTCILQIDVSLLSQARAHWNEGLRREKAEAEAAQARLRDSQAQAKKEKEAWDREKAAWDKEKDELVAAQASERKSREESEHAAAQV